MQLLITSIKQGVVIDHIPAQYTLAVMNVLQLKDASSPVIIATNLASNTLEKKGIIKIANRTFSQEELNAIALLAYGATLNIIEAHTVVKKITITLPDILEKVAKCPNIRCISNFDVDSKFIKITQEEMQCYYCEKSYTREDISPYKNK